MVVCGVVVCALVVCALTRCLPWLQGICPSAQRRNAGVHECLQAQQLYSSYVTKSSIIRRLHCVAVMARRDSLHSYLHHKKLVVHHLHIDRLVVTVHRTIGQIKPDP